MTTPTFRLITTPTLIAQRLVPGSLQISFDLQRRSVCTFRLLPVSGTGLEIGQQVVLRNAAAGELLFRGTVDSDRTSPTCSRAARRTTIRERLSGYYPEPAWLRRMTHWCRYQLGMGTYAPKRATPRGDALFATLSLARALQLTIQLAFMLDQTTSLSTSGLSPFSNTSPGCTTGLASWSGKP